MNRSSLHACTAISGAPRQDASSNAVSSAHALLALPSTPTTTGPSSVSRPRTTTTEQWAWAETPSVVEPASIPVKPPAPELPRTIIRAPRDRDTSRGAAGSSGISEVIVTSSPATSRAVRTASASVLSTARTSSS